MKVAVVGNATDKKVVMGLECSRVEAAILCIGARFVGSMPGEYMSRARSLAHAIDTALAEVEKLEKEYAVHPTGTQEPTAVRAVKCIRPASIRGGGTDVYDHGDPYAVPSPKEGELPKLRDPARSTGGGEDGVGPKVPSPVRGEKA